MDVDDHGIQKKSSMMQLKGKTGNRGWARLPPDVLKIVFNIFVRECDSYPVPTSWDDEMTYPHRMLYTALRTAVHIQQYTHVCRAWRAALNNHTFWAHICSLLDPTATVAQWRKNQIPTGNSSAVQEVRPNYTHYQIIRNNCCIPCRMRSPLSKEGFGQIRRLGNTSHTGRIGLCREHKADTFCGTCLRPEVATHDDAGVDEFFEMVVCKTEDEEVFHEIEATCTKCRSEALCRRAMHDPCLSDSYSTLQKDRTKVDWEIRQAIEQYIEYGEGTLQRIVSIAWEKTWLHSWTKIGEFLDQAVASVRYQNREEGYDSADEISDDEDVLCFQEEAGVRDIAMGDFCHHRIVDGNWSVPFDTFLANVHRHQLRTIPAHHPIPYMFPVKPGEVHPSKWSEDVLPPPTNTLAEALSRNFHKEMQRVIGPALQNLVRKVILECNRNHVEPSVHASKMDVEDIIQGLRDEGVWWDGFDWAAKWDENDKRERIRLRNDRPPEEEEVSSTASDYSSSNSHQTSPVLSTSTLQTTPSPPPIEGGFADKSASTAAPVVPPTAPPSILRIVPFVPESSVHMPHYTKELLKQLWREAAAPIFHCKCTVCTRAMSAEGASTAANAVAEQLIQKTPLPTAPVSFPAAEEVFEEEEELEDDLDDQQLQQALALERELNGPVHHVVPSQTRRQSFSPPLPHQAQKRSSEELTDDSEPPYEDSSTSDTPTKRIKLGQHILTDSQELRRRESIHKRSSEEMESDTPISGSGEYIPQKRAKQQQVDTISTTPRAMSRQGSYADVDSERGATAATLQHYTRV